MRIGARGVVWLIGSLVLLLGQVATVAAQPPRLSEFEPNPIGSDPVSQSIELSGIPGADFDGAIVSVECDVDPLTIDRSSAATGTFDADGLLTVSIPDLENPSFILLLVDGAPPTIGVSPVGLLSSANVLDAIGIPDATTDVARCSPQSIDPSLSGFPGFQYTGDEPRLVFRDGSFGEWYAINDPDRNQVFDINATDVGPDSFVIGDPFVSSFGALNPATAPPVTPRISEFEPNPFGSDPATQFVELSGTPGNAFDGCVVSVDCDTSDLTVDRASAVSGNFDLNGLLTATVPDLENPSFTLLLVNGSCPTTGIPPTGQLSSANVLDAIGIPDAATDVARCSPQSIDPSLSGFPGFQYTGDEPRLVFRDASVSDWYAINDPPAGAVYDINANNVGPGIFLSGDPFVSSFDAINPSTDVVSGPTFTPRKIHEIQGSGPTVTNPGELVEVQAVVIGLFDRVVAGAAELDGFFIQEEDADADADANTSEGIFVFCRGACPALAEGDLVTVQGTPAEFFGMSQIDATGGSISIDATTSLPSPATVILPAAGRTDAEATFESVEGMLVNFPQDLFVAEYFQLARFGQVVLSQGGRPRQFTDASLPSVPGYQQHLEDIAKRRILLDDLNNVQNFNDPLFHPQPNGFSTGDYFRGGDAVSNLTGVMHWSFAGSSGTDAWRVRPTQTAPAAFTPLNMRTVAPEGVGGSLRVATMNVLNYFNTVDEPGNTCGPGSTECRGADSEAERLRQLDKITAALSAIDADIVGLVELENDSTDAAIASIVAELTDYAYIATGFIGSDAIKVGIIYKTTTVSPVGAFALLDSSVDATFIDSKNRPALIQTFEENAGGGRFTIAVNHFKSKGSPCDDVGDPGTTDGQGNCNGVRTDAATALANYLATDPTGSGDGDFLILGDLNAYAMEDPIKALESAGYDNLISLFRGANAYSFLFDGQLGYLDHALATTSLTAQVTGVTEWHINADEVPVLDYNDAVQDPSEAPFEVKPSVNTLYSADPYRSSDHDPVIVGLNLTSPVIQRCEIDGNGQIDINDVRAITARRNQPASGPDDPADADGDGVITVSDARQCVLQCANPRCAP